MLAGFTILQSCDNSKRISDLDKTNLKGKVKCVSEHYFSTSIDENGIVTSNRIKINKKNYTETYYDEDGMIEKVITVLEDNIINVDEYIYENRLLEKISHKYNLDVMPLHTTYVYNKQGLAQEKHVIWDDGEYYCRYDSNGNLISDGVYEYTYDSNSMLTSDGVYEYKYDDKNNIIEESSHEYKCISIYDEFNRKTEYAIERKEEDGKVNHEHVSVEYDKDGRILKEIHTHDSKIYTITYDYREQDNRGNWRNKYIYINDELTNSIRRHIEYYEEEVEEPRTDEFGLALQEIKKAYEKGLSHSEVLKIPELRNLIVSRYSNKYYELMLKKSSDKNILHRNEFGEYFVEYSDAFETYNKLCFNENQVMIFFDLYGIYVRADGTLNILPWKKDYYKNEFAEKDMNDPFYYIEEEFSGNVKIEIRIDDVGVYFIKKNRDQNFHSGAELKIKVNGEQNTLELPAQVFEGILFLEWENFGTHELIELWSYENTKLAIIDTDVAGKTNYYTKDFSRMEGTKLIESFFNGGWLQLQNNKTVPPHRLEGLW